MSRIKDEESRYQELPKFYSFASKEEMETILTNNFRRINNDVEYMLTQLLGPKNSDGTRNEASREVQD